MDSVWVCVCVCGTIVKHTQCKQMVMINEDTGLDPQFQPQRENCWKKFFFKKIACPEVHFYCFPFLLLAIICVAKGEQRIDYLTRMFTRAKLGSLKMKRMPKGKKKKKRAEKLILRMMVSPNDLFIYKIYINICIYNAERLQLKKKCPSRKMKGLHSASESLQALCSSQSSKNNRNCLLTNFYV